MGFVSLVGSKTEYRRYVCFEPVRPVIAVNFLEFRKPYNHLCSDNQSGFRVSLVIVLIVSFPAK